MSEHLDFYLPMDLATRKLYHQWIRGMLASNTFLVLPDLFIHARTAALLSFNFLQFYPTSSILIVNAEKEKDGICAQLKAVGISLKFIHQIKDDKQFKKQFADGVADNDKYAWKKFIE
uniref:Uncharacterized protein n=1 Tax=Panagrolaimus sp. PS1159 TaxID=55785 RepID=A0AC35F185_9BILA